MNERIAMLEAREKPDAARIIDEVRASLQNAQAIGVFEKIAECHNIRRCLWANQSADGLKHGDDAFPWDRALDYKARVAERIITDNVRIRMAAVRSGTVQIGPENEFEDSVKAQTWDRVLKFYRNKGKRMMRNELRLFFNCVEEFGYGVMHVDWHERMHMLPQKLSLDLLLTKLVQAQIDRVRAESGMEPDEAMIQSIVETTNITVEEALVEEDRSAMVRMVKEYDPQIPTSEAVRAASALRKGERDVEYIAPRSLGGMPCVKALIPWVNCLHGVELTESGWNTWMAIPSWKTEVELRMCAEMEEWNPAVVERVLQYPNRGLMEMINQTNLLPDWLLNGTGMGLAPDRQSQYRIPMYQVLCVYRIAMNEAGVPAIYETVVSPNVTDAVLGHECEPIKMMPFVVEARESAGLIVQSRGIPELVQGEQIATKKMMDGSVAAGELAAFPPNLRYPGDDQKPKPGASITVTRQTGTQGQQVERFQKVPGVDMGALKLLDFIKQDLNDTFHRGANADPDLRQMMIDEMGESAVLSYEEMIKVLWCHVQAYVTNVKASRIAGRPVDLEATEEDLMGEADINMQFSALALNKKAAGELADWLTKMAPLDREGRYNMGTAVETITRLYDPTLAETIVEPVEVASGRVDDEEQADLAKLASGQLPPVRQGAYQQRMKKMQEWLANPAVQQQMAADPILAQRVQQRWDAYVQNGITQPRNAMVGRVGYDPSKDPVLGAAETPQLPGVMAEQPA